jgi:hypothetical protein
MIGKRVPSGKVGELRSEPQVGQSCHRIPYPGGLRESSQALAYFHET